MSLPVSTRLTFTVNVPAPSTVVIAEAGPVPVEVAGQLDHGRVAADDELRRARTEDEGGRVGNHDGAAEFQRWSWRSR